MLNLHFLRGTQRNSPVNVNANSQPIHLRTLGQSPEGKQVTISGFSTLPLSHRQHLQAYGLLPGRTVQVLAQSPVTIVLVEETELAFESEIANQVIIE